MPSRSLIARIFYVPFSVLETLSVRQPFTNTPPPCWFCVTARAAVTNKLAGSGGWGWFQTTEMEVLSPKSRYHQGWSLQGPSPWRVDGRLLPCSHVVVLPSVCVGVLISSSYKDPSHIGLSNARSNSF